MARIALIGNSQSEALWPLVRSAMPTHEFVLVRTERGWFEYGYKNEGKVAQQLKDAKPDVVVIELGGNNYLTTAGKYQPYVDWMLEAARQSGAKRILWLGPAAATKEPNKTNKEWTRGFQQSYLTPQPNLTWMDSFPYTQTGHRDGVHFSAKVYKPWSEVIVAAIEAEVKAATSPPLALAGLSGNLPVVLGLSAVLLVGAGYYWYRRSRR